MLSTLYILQRLNFSPNDHITEGEVSFRQHYTISYSLCQVDIEGDALSFAYISQGRSNNVPILFGMNRTGLTFELGPSYMDATAQLVLTILFLVYR